MIRNSVITENFAAPLLCENILKYLNAVVTPFYWIDNGINYCLQANIFDDDNYYHNSNKAIADAGLYKIIPAFTLAELSKMCPDYMVEKRNGRYLICADEHFNLSAWESDYQVDGLAMLVIEGLKKGVFDQKYLERNLIIISQSMNNIWRK